MESIQAFIYIFYEKLLTHYLHVYKNYRLVIFTIFLKGYIFVFLRYVQ